MKKLILACVALLAAAIPAAATTPLGYVAMTCSNLQDANGNLVASATIKFSPVNGSMMPISFQVNGHGQSTMRTVTALVTNGVCGALQLADTALTNPANICYSVTMSDNSTGKSLLGPGYSCVQPAGSGAAVTSGFCTAAGSSGGSCNFDSYTPNLGSLAIIQMGPTGPQGPAGPNALTSTAAPITTCSATTNNGSFDVSAEPKLYHCDNLIGSTYQWNAVGGGSSYAGVTSDGASGIVVAGKVAASATVSAIEDKGGQVYNLAAYGGKGDGILFNDCAIASGTNSVTCTSETFSSADIGKLFDLYGAGTSGALLATTISGVTSLHVATLATNAGTTVASGGTGMYGTDNATAIAAWKAACSANCTLLAPMGMFLTSAQFAIQQSNVSLVGSGNSSQLAYAGSTSIDAAVKFYPTGTPNTSCGGSACLSWDSVRDITLRGNSNAGDVLLILATHDSYFSNLTLRDALTYALETQFVVKDSFFGLNLQLAAASSSSTLTPTVGLYTPAQGVHLSQISSGATTGPTDWHGLEVRNTAGCGVLIDSGFENSFFGGNIIHNGTGLCLSASGSGLAGASQSTFAGMDVEQNTTAVNTNGSFDQFINLQEGAGGGFIVGTSAQYERIIGGGFSAGCSIASGAFHTFIDSADCNPLSNSSPSTQTMGYAGGFGLGYGNGLSGYNASAQGLSIAYIDSSGDVVFGPASGTAGGAKTMFQAAAAGFLFAGATSPAEFSGNVTMDLGLTVDGLLTGDSVGTTQLRLTNASLQYNFQLGTTTLGLNDGTNGGSPFTIVWEPTPATHWYRIGDSGTDGGGCVTSSKLTVCGAISDGLTTATNKDNRGKLTLVAGTASYTFTQGPGSSGVWTTAPICQVQDQTFANQATTTLTVSASTLTIANATGTTDTYTYHCWPGN